MLAASAQNKWGLGSVHFQFHSTQTVIYRFIKEHLSSVFSLSSVPPNQFVFGIKYPICELAELKVHWAQPWNKHDYANVTWLKKILSVRFLQFGVRRRPRSLYPADQEVMQRKQRRSTLQLRMAAENMNNDTYHMFFVLRFSKNRTHFFQVITSWYYIVKKKTTTLPL